MPRQRKRWKKSNAATKAKKKKRLEAATRELKPDHFFMMVDGSTLKSLKDLLDAFETMSDDVFYYHVNEERNDFANWIRDCIGEVELAENLAKELNKDKAHIIVLKYFLNLYTD